MRRGDAFPSNYLSKADCETPIRATMREVQLRNLPGMADDECKPVLSFMEEGIKPLILNHTNWDIIQDVYGDETDNWGGRAIEIYLDPNIRFGDRRVGGVRVRVPGGAAAPSPERPAPQEAAAVTSEGAAKRYFAALAAEIFTPPPNPLTTDGREWLAENWKKFRADAKIASLGDDWPALAEHMRSWLLDMDIPF